MLHIAWDNIKNAQDRTRFYVDHNRDPDVLNIGKKVFLYVLSNSKA